RRAHQRRGGRCPRAHERQRPRAPPPRRGSPARVPRARWRGGGGVTSRPGCTAPLSLDALLGYLLGELPEVELDAIEDHLFECAQCHRRLAALDDLRRAVAEAVRGAALGGSVTGA